MGFRVLVFRVSGLGFRVFLRIRIGGRGGGGGGGLPSKHIILGSAQDQHKHKRSSMWQGILNPKP